MFDHVKCGITEKLVPAKRSACLPELSATQKQYKELQCDPKDESKKLYCMPLGVLDAGPESSG